MASSSLNSIITTSPLVAGNPGGSEGGGTAGENHSLAIELLTRCALAGIDVTLNDRGGLRISGPPAKVEFAKPEVAAAKLAIIAYLASRQAPISWPVVPIADDPEFQSPEGQQRFHAAFGMTLSGWSLISWFCSAMDDGGDLELVWGWWLRDDAWIDASRWWDVKATGNRIAAALARWQRLSEAERVATLSLLAGLRHVVANYTTIAAHPADLEIFSAEKTFSPAEMQSALRDYTVRQRHTLRGRRPRSSNRSGKRKRSD